MAALAPHAGHAHVVGLTGSPGVGKSTTTSALVTELRGRGQRVGVLAVDPSSPFSGGALLGDRVRMQDHATDREVFIRSMASRGHLGGLSWATPQALRVLDAAGCDVVLVETVGVGQTEVEIAGLADTTVVLLAPGMGDGDPGRQGRHPRDRRRLRREQGRPRRRRPGTPRAALDAGRSAERRRGRVAAADRQDGRGAGRGPRRGRRRARPAPRLARGSRRARHSGAPGGRRDEVEAIAVTALRARSGDLHGDAASSTSSPGPWSRARSTPTPPPTPSWRPSPSDPRRRRRAGAWGARRGPDLLDTWVGHVPDRAEDGSWLQWCWRASSPSCCCWRRRWCRCSSRPRCSWSHCWLAPSSSSRRRRSRASARSATSGAPTTATSPSSGSSSGPACADRASCN